MKDRKTVILEAAARVIACRGVRGLRVEEVAAEARVSKALVYYHFKDRAGLLRRTLRFVGDRAERYTRGGGPGDAAPRGPGPGDLAPGARVPGDPLRELERRLLLEFQDLPEVRENSTAWGELRASAVFEPELREELARAGREWVREIADLLGPVGPAVPDAALVSAAERLTVLVEGLSTRWLVGLLPAGHAAELLRGAVAAEAEGLRRAAVRTACPAA
ncbi:TetR/AcrR family transcriptional regulator [Streptomyces sp. NPDC004111]|uniref:TetR/AcrR family transcriptional regulator n=1 Tax=Streptomyces sp. NPDC004111 TaxID=3364690 RepID=UPI003687DEEF